METKKKIYELPISRNYVHNWGAEEAVREIMQNAVDSGLDGNEVEVTYDNGKLTISNIGTNIDISSLVLGNSDKSDVKYVGTYGEGYKLALLVLLREGYRVSIATNGQIWEPAFRKSRKFKTETLHIDVFTASDFKTDIVTFVIDGMEYGTFTALRDNSIAMMKAMGHSLGETLDSEYGEILMEDRFKGKMFVNGLFISQDTSFKYGYNFKSELVKLDRDRKAINYYKLRELTALALTSQDDVWIVEEAIVSSKLDVRDIVEYIDKVSVEFKTNFANDFMKRNDIDEDTFVGTKKQVAASKREKTFIVKQSAIAELVNHGTGNVQQFKVIKSKTKLTQDKSDAYDYYYGSGLESLVKFLTPKLDMFDNDEKEELRTILENDDLHPSYFGTIMRHVYDGMFRGEE